MEHKKSARADEATEQVVEPYRGDIRGRQKNLKPSERLEIKMKSQKRPEQVDEIVEGVRSSR